MNRHLIALALLGIALLLTGTFATASKTKTVPMAPTTTGSEETPLEQKLTGEEINWQVISSGGTTGSSSSYSLSGTIGQTAVGTGSSSSYSMSHGYWQSFEDTEPGTCGDVDASGGIDIDDIVYLIAYVFQGGPEPIPLESGEVNCSGGTDIDDIVYLIAYVFQGGDAPCDPDGNGVPDC